MNREETAELIKVMQAYLDGKQIQYYKDGIWKDTSNPSWSSITVYRIKPEPKYHPFEDAEECWQEMQKHQPFGWITDNKPQNGAPCNGGQAQLIVCIHDAVVSVAPYFEEKYGNIQKNTATDGSYTYEQALKQFWFMDGTPFGIKVE